MSSGSDTSPVIAIVDIGKTNAKLSLIDTQTQSELWAARRANAVISASYGTALDILAIEQWLIESLRNAPFKDLIHTIVPIAHGAAAVLIDAQGEILAAPDYEDNCYSTVNAQYQRIRDAYTETLSPDLPAGLNLGRQWHYLQQRHTDLFSRAAHLVLYPQYWAWRLSGVLASEVTSLGCHSDIWAPRAATYSALAQQQGWVSLLPPIRPANDILGTVIPRIVALTGLNPNCTVACGVHDSNASWLRFLIGREHQPFTVVSSGTWTVVMTNHGELSCLQEQRDMLANVDVFGFPIPTARYMGGREYELIAGGNDGRPIVTPTMAALRQVIDAKSMAFPAFAVAGPYQHRQGQCNNIDTLDAAGRATLATIYSVLMTRKLIESLNVPSDSDIFIDGPFASNPLFACLLATALPAHRIKIWCDSVAAFATKWLAGLGSAATSPATDQIQTIDPLHIPGLIEYLQSYQEAW